MPAQSPSEDTQKPSVYIFIGDDLDAIRSVEVRFIKEMGNPDYASLNIARLHGQVDSLDELLKNVSLFPFGVERRLVIFAQPLDRINKSDTERWQQIMEHIPPTTALVLEIHSIWVKTKNGWKWDSYASHPWFEKWSAQKEAWLYKEEFRIPSRSGLPARIQQMVSEEGGKIQRPVALELAGIAGNDVLRLRQEVKKLCTYTGFEREITRDDVRMLCTLIPEEDVFAMVDAFALGDSSTALHHLKLMFANQDYVRVFSMIVRQFRMLLLTKEALSEGISSADTIAGLIHEHPYVVKKVIQQCRRFTYEELKQIYFALYDLDGEIKRGNVLPEVGLELVFFEKIRTPLGQE
ncbi:MAG: DNA polymerase III delta subunit [Anaerolinea thermophila]|uniref:DNA polymerase III subunit delta n=1 Tax=Anaerolinea thermophila TaxID=167964 RepID=A0A101FYP3_9CHLR|nr:MAG: DNA polymerase III delta subunit [Anaerolinea thermophila]